MWNGRVVAVNQEKAELGRRESIEKFNKAQLKKTNTIEKNSLPDTQGMKWMDWPLQRGSTGWRIHRPIPVFCKCCRSTDFFVYFGHSWAKLQVKSTARCAKVHSVRHCRVCAPELRWSVVHWPIFPRRQFLDLPCTVLTVVAVVTGSRRFEHFCDKCTRWTTLAADQTPNTIQDRRYSVQGLDNTTAELPCQHHQASCCFTPISVLRKESATPRSY